MINAAFGYWSPYQSIFELLPLFLMTCFDLVKPHPVCNQTFLWLTTCNRDALHLNKKRNAYEYLTALFKLQCTWSQWLEPENGHLSTATLSIKGQHWPPCHKMACSGYSLFDFPTSLSPSWSTLFHMKEVSCIVLLVNYCKSSIILPLAHCTRMDGALEQVSRGNTTVFYCYDNLNSSIPRYNCAQLLQWTVKQSDLFKKRCKQVFFLSWPPPPLLFHCAPFIIFFPILSPCLSLFFFVRCREVAPSCGLQEKQKREKEKKRNGSSVEVSGN